MKKKQIFKLILLFFFSIMLPACSGPFSGQLKVFEPIKLTDKEHIATLIKPGVYETRINWKSGRSFFELLLEDYNGRKKAFRFYIPQEMEFTNDPFSFSLSAVDIKQPFDLTGEVKISQSITDTHNGYEACTSQWMITECAGNEPKGCRKVWRSAPGLRSVEFYYFQQFRYLNIQLVKQKTAHVVAEFNGEALNQWKVYTYRGDCIRVAEHKIF
ncbi:MAG: hypothetical protein JRH18_13900 [Deltaproteobacteria bacterium]|nr:hypothetical protein [Deltaproteobacteria bacterium]MBW2152749.1 hypothetical protein [Deltaproteobacteria bacterium]